MKIENKSKFYPIGLAVGLLCLSACSAETPFETEGKGVVRMNVSMNSTATRGDISEEVLKELNDKCVIYISDKEGLLHKWVGVQNVPSELALKYDDYVAEAWSGDSVSASFESKFYKGLTKFTVSANNTDQNVVINCKLANVVVSVNNATIDPSVMKDVEIIVANTADNLDFKDNTLTKRGYFMMPDNDSQLRYLAYVTGMDNQTVKKEGVIPDVEPGYHYILNFTTEEAPSTTGGAFFDIVVKEYEEEKEEEFVIYGKPAFSWSNPALKVDGQIVHTEESDPFVTEILRVAAYNGGFDSMVLNTGNMASSFGNNQQYDLVKVVDSSALSQLKEYGVDVIKGESENTKGLYVWQILFDEKLFNKLEKSSSEYYMTLTATDKAGKSNTTKIRIANQDEAVRYEDPVVVDTKAFQSDYMAVGATSATIPVNIVDGSKDMALLYKVQNDSQWKKEVIIATRDGELRYVTLSNLQDSKTYDYKVVSGDRGDGTYDFESQVYTFETESKFIIPNASMDQWFEASSKLWEPALDSSHSFWDTGNHGSAGYGYTLTKGSTDYVTSGQCAKLETVNAIIQLAAGNLFVGKFEETLMSPSVGARVTFGRPYNGSHPKSLRFKAKYIPKTINKNKDKAPDEDFKNSTLDHGQVFIAIASSHFTVNTSNKVYFDPTDETILGYKEITWKEAFGSGDTLDEVELVIDYNERAKTTEATTLIIVASASKYGDYFAGGVGSTMYLDDFELVY